MENQNNELAQNKGEFTEAFSNAVNNHHLQSQFDEVTGFTNEHHFENKVAPNLEAPKVTEFKIDYDGKAHRGLTKQSKKMDRRTFLKLLGATAIAAIGYKMTKDIVVPEVALANSMQETRDLVGQIVSMDPSFENNTEFKTATNENGKFYIESSDKKGYDDLINYLTTYSKNSDGKDAGKGLSQDQAIYAISICGRNADYVPDNLYETYYHKSKEDLLKEKFSGKSSIYQNYMQSGLSLAEQNVVDGISYADGINNLKQNIYQIDKEKESGKAL